MEKQIKLFLEFIQNNRKLSENTLQSYRRDIMQYSEYIEKNKINYVKVTKKDIEEYLSELEKQKKELDSYSRMYYYLENILK